MPREQDNADAVHSPSDDVCCDDQKNYLDCDVEVFGHRSHFFFRAWRSLIDFSCHVLTFKYFMGTLNKQEKLWTFKRYSTMHRTKKLLKFIGMNFTLLLNFSVDQKHLRAIWAHCEQRSVVLNDLKPLKWNGIAFNNSNINKITFKFYC